MNRMKLTKWKPVHVDLAAVGVLLVLAAIAYVVGVRPVVLRHEGFDLRADELKVKQGEDRDMSRKVADVASQITRINQELSDSTIELKPASRINSHLDRIARLAGQCGLKLDRLRPDKSLPGPRYQTVPIYLAGSGNFPACVKLMRELQRLFPDTSVASFEVKGDPTKPDEPSSLRVDLLWYALANMDITKG